MKVKVINRYVDRYTFETMEEGTTVEYEPERAKELMDGGYVEPVKSPAKGKKSAKKGE